MKILRMKIKLYDVAVIMIITLVLLFLGDLLLKDYANELKNTLSSQSGNQPIHRTKLPLEYYEIDQDRLWKDYEIMNNQGFKKATFHAYYHFRSSKVETRYMNIDSNGLRKTLKTPNKNAKKIFMFGGSTLWGLGVPDKYTIPSIMSEKLGPKFDVINFGESSFVSGQEFNLLLEQLNNGNIPDAVIFYDGVNEAYAGVYSPGIPGTITQHLEMEKLFKAFQDKSYQTDKISLAIKYTFLYIREKIGATSYGKIASYLKNKNKIIKNGSTQPKMDVNELNDKAKEVVGIYENRIIQIKAIADAYGFKAYFFWQPYMMSGIKKPIGFEQGIVKALGSRWVQNISKVYEHARKRFSSKENKNIYFIADVFKNVDHPVYMDDCHVDSRGNLIIATKIVDLLSNNLDKL